MTTAQRELAERAASRLMAAGVAISFLPRVQGTRGGPAHYGDEIIVKLRPGASSAAFLAHARSLALEPTRHYRYGDRSRFILRVSPGRDAPTLARQLEASKQVQSARPDIIGEGRLLYTPNDPMFDQQPAFQTLGITRAWDRTKGSRDVAVASFDTGIVVDHADLAGNLVAGYDAVDDDATPQMESDEDSHGTLVAGAIAAVTDNNRGVAGVGFRNRLIAVKVGFASECFLGGSGCATFSCAAIERAAAHVIGLRSVDVVAVNLSFIIFQDGLRECFREALEDIRTYAREGRGAVVLAGTGNDGVETSAGFPVNFPFVVGAGQIAGTNQPLAERRHFRSNFGPFVDVMASVTESTSCNCRIGLNDVTDGYFFFDGTSAATALTSGVVGLVGAANPSLRADALESILLHATDFMSGGGDYAWTHDRVYGMKSGETGFGRVNAFKAVRMASRRRLPETLHPLLYVHSATTGRKLYVLDKDPDRLWPGVSSELLRAEVPVSPPRLDAEYLMVPLRVGDERFIYRVGRDEERIERFDPLTGDGAGVYRKPLRAAELPAAAIAYTVPVRGKKQATMLVAYYPLAERQRTYRVERAPASLFAPRLKLQLVHSVPLKGEQRVRYGVLGAGTGMRLLRADGSGRSIAFLAIDPQSGAPSTVAGRMAMVSDAEPVPDLWAAYEGADRRTFVYVQKDPWAYRISEVSADAQVLASEDHDSVLSEVQADGVAVHHVYDQDRPFFLFWNRKGIVKVKHLVEDLQFFPLDTNLKSFRAPGDPEQIWSLATILAF